MLNQVLKDLEQIASREAVSEGFEIVVFQVRTNTQPMNIQAQIRLQGGGDVSLDDCARFSKVLGDSIDNSHLFDISHVLEISSPGLNDILTTDKEFETFKGFPIDVLKKNKTNSQIIESGLLHTRSKEYLLINSKGRISKIPREQVIQVRLACPT